MARGAREKAREAEEARRTELFGAIRGEAAAIPRDYTPEQRAAITRARLGGIDIGYGNLLDEAMRRYARTGATAGYGELLGELGRERTREKSRAGAELETGFAEVPVQRALQRAGVLSGLYGPSTSYLSSLYQYQPGLLDRILGATQAAAPFLSRFGGGGADSSGGGAQGYEGLLSAGALGGA